MNIKEAKRILEAYLKGIDLETGEELEVVQLNPLLSDAIKKIISPSREEIQVMLNESCGYPSRRGFSWSPAEDSFLSQNFALNKSYDELASIHKRSKVAISKRLEYLGLAKDIYQKNIFLKKKKFSIYI